MKHLQIKKLMIYIISNFLCWYLANFKDYPYWTVKYKDRNIRGRIIFKDEARRVAKDYGGWISIDYKKCRENALFSLKTKGDLYRRNWLP